MGRHDRLEEYLLLRTACRWRGVGQRIKTILNYHEILGTHPHRAIDAFEIILDEARALVADLEYIKENGYDDPTRGE